ncbi:hypothetical protein T484DRAFT_1802723, partial [Baffinella frigidus]
IALTELKSVACQNLEWEQFFAIFAKNDMNLLRTKYYGGLRNQLTEPSKRFWDKQIKRYTLSPEWPVGAYALQ